MAGTGQDVDFPRAEIQRIGDVSHPVPPVPFYEKYIFAHTLGSGGEAICDRFEVVETGKAVAVKTIIRPSRYTNYLHEADILALMPKHPCIIEVLEVYQDENLRIVMPLCSGGDLVTQLENLHRFGCKTPEAYAWHVFIQLASGLHHLHTNDALPILHRDLKPENVLVRSTESGILFDDVLIIDFGMATTEVQPHEHRGGTPVFQPPESPLASKAADVYALGASIYFLLTVWYSRAPPLIHRLVDSCHTNYDSGVLSHDDAARATFDHPTPLPNKAYSPLLEHWVRRALDPDPATRATTAELLMQMKADGERQIRLYEEWIAAAPDQRLMCGFVSIEPPAGWRP